jgi:predicted DNA-binding transcriptional regulator AlpA
MVKKHTGDTRQPSPLLKQLLTDMNGVCAIAAIDRATGWRWLKAGILPAPTIKVGRVVRWNTAAIEKWATEGMTA